MRSNWPSAEAIGECPGVGPALALQIYQFFHPQAETEAQEAG